MRNDKTLKKYYLLSKLIYSNAKLRIENRMLKLGIKDTYETHQDIVYEYDQFIKKSDHFNKEHCIGCNEYIALQKGFNKLMNRRNIYKRRYLKLKDKLRRLEK